MPRPSMPHSTASATATAAHAIMFWVLAGMAFALFAPAVLLPLWEESRAIHAYEQARLIELARLKAERDRNDARIEALSDDPLVIERIARRERIYRPEGEQATHWSSQELASVPVKVPPGLVDEQTEDLVPPSWVSRAQQWLPNWPYQKLFVKMPNRLLMLLMSAGLLVTAFVLYGPNGPSRPVATGRAGPRTGGK